MVARIIIILCALLMLAATAFGQNNGGVALHRRDASRPKAAGGTPTGNAFTIRGFASTCNSTSFAPVNIDGAIGDIWIIWFKWEGSGTVTTLQGGDSGTATARGTQIDHGGGDLHSRFWTVVAASATVDEDFTVSVSGTLTFRDWAVWRVVATGTIDYSIHNGATGTGTSASSGNITTVTVNGIALVCVGVDNSSTFSSLLVAGNAATNVRDLTGTSSHGWDYVHTAQIVAGQATGTINTSVGWTCNILALSAQ